MSNRVTTQKTGKVKIAVLVSGGGTNLQALIDATAKGIIKHGEIALVISNKADAYAFTRAQRANIPAVYIKKTTDKQSFEQEIHQLLIRYEIGLTVLAGFTYIFSPYFTSLHRNTVINIHPSLIPAFCGKGFYGIKVHEAVLASKATVTGATVHFVNEIPDGGSIIAQKKVKVFPDDTPEQLQRRVMEQAEWILLPRTVETICAEILEEKKCKT